MSTLEISILIAAGVALLSANLVASLRVVRRLERYSIPYVLFIWLAPVIGALYVLAKIRPAPPESLLPIDTDTVSNNINPITIQPDPWPTASKKTESHSPFRK